MRLVESLRSWPCLLLAFALSLPGMPAAAQYKWKDAQGQMHASDLPPPVDIPEKNILQRPVPRSPGATPVVAAASATAVAASATRPPPVDPELEARRKRAEQEASAKASADEQRVAAQRAENCRRARDQLATLGSGQRLARTNAQGERIVLDDAGRAAEAADARRVIEADCR